MRSPAGTGGVAFLDAAGRPARLPNIGHAHTPATQGVGVPYDARRAGLGAKKAAAARAPSPAAAGCGVRRL